MNTAKCVILVPANGAIETDTEQALGELERRGYVVVRGRGCSQIDLMRSQMASDFLAKDFEETMWIDSDVGFLPEDVDRIRAHNLPICCGLYPRKGQRTYAAKLLPEPRSIVFGTGGGLVEIKYAGTGFLHVRRGAYDLIRAHHKLPMCNRLTGRPVVPYFLPLTITEDEENLYLSEDYSFCERARQCGLKVMADTSVRLWHIGPYRFSWEEAGLGVPRVESVVMEFEIDGTTVASAAPRDS